jgi:hypothetical protein
LWTLDAGIAFLPEEEVSVRRRAKVVAPDRTSSLGRIGGAALAA